MSRELPRLVDQVPPAGSADTRLRELIARQSPPGPLSPAQLARVRRNIAARTEARQANWTVVAWAAAGAIVIATTSMGWAQAGSLGARVRDTGRQLVASVFGAKPRPRQIPATPVEPELPAAPSLPALSTVPTQLALAPAPTLAATAPAPPTRPLAAVRVARALAPSAPAPLPPLSPAAPTPIAAAPTPSPAGPSALALEADSLREVARLLQSGSAEQALHELAIHRARFPSGALTEEADLAELDADVTLDHRDAALGLLTKLERGGSARPAELRLLHGELLAKGGDCAGALARWGSDLPAVPELAERTLYGRASCLAALGRTGESREAMGQYLSRFPQGRSAAAVRAALAPAKP